MPFVRAPSSALAFALALVGAASLGCDRSSSSPDPNTGGSPPPGGARTLLVPTSHPLYERFEAPSATNTCKGDGACVRSGCSSEVCAAEELMSSCEVLAVQIPASAACGCVAGECAWFSTDGTTLPASGGGGGAGGGAPCGDAVCRPEETCIGYYGIAGPSGPMFYTCAIPCRRGAPNDGCPEGRRCVTIADGPGDICQ